MKRLGLDGGRLKWSHSDPGTDYTDRKLREVSNRLKDLYEEAANDLYMKQQSFIHGHAARVQKYLAKVEAGEMTRTDFEAWMQGQVFQGEQWAQKREQIARQMVDIDKQAQQIVNEGKLSVFAENANYMGWKLEKGAGANLGFGVYDRATVSRLVRDQPNLLPMPKIDAGKDYAWYNGVVNRAVTQGIMQGEDLEDIVFRLSLETGEKSLSAMRRNARTAYTGAQNAGRLEGMRQARDKLGVKVKKRWLAFLDSHTRDAHAELDGEVADIDEPFNSKLGPIMCPGDPEAEPANVYNCRCTLEDYYPEYPDSGDRIDENGENVGDMSYKEWREMKADKTATKAGSATENTTMKENDRVARIVIAEIAKYYGKVQLDVYMPDERKDHIKEHHPNDYDAYIGYVENAIKAPVMVLDDHRSPNTAMFIGETEKDNINVIVKLAFSEDKDDRSFTVTMHPAGEKTLKKLKKRYKTVYKRLES